MKPIMLLLVFNIFLTLGCDSPINNKVEVNDQPNLLGVNTISFHNSALQAEFRWLLGPFGNVNKKNHLLVILYKKGSPYSLPKNQTLEFYSTMPSMGHSMEDAGYFEELEPGVYLNKNIRYNMSGQWKNELWVLDNHFNIMDRLEWADFF